MQKSILQSGSQAYGLDQQNTSNTAETLTTMGFTIEDEGASPLTATIYCETFAVRFGAGVVTATKGGVLNPGEYLLLESEKEIRNTKFISETAGSHGLLNIVNLTHDGK